MKDKALLALKEQGEATAAEIDVPSSQLTRLAKQGLVRSVRLVSAGNGGRKANVYKLTREGAVLARKVAKKA